MKLLLNASLKLALGLLLVALCLFLPAGTLAYPGGWLFLGLLFVPMLILGLVLFFKAPALLKKRLNPKEKEKTQKGVVALSGLLFFAGFLLSALDHRFSLSSVPLWLTVLASLLFLLGYALYAEVLRENAYLSRTVEIQENQKVIDTGLYGLLRHPMYFATLLMFLPLPLILGSFWGLLPLLPYPFLLVLRIRNEEKLLAEGLAGYSDYQNKVRYRLLSWIW